jgi:hypothetical protein
MSKQQDERSKNLRELLRQHWDHCRHIESERAWFMSVFAAITGGTLAYILTSSTESQWPFYFLMLLTAIGLLLNIRWTQAFNHHRDKVKETAKTLGINGDVWAPSSKLLILKTGYLFIAFYALTFIGLIILVDK